MPQTLPTPAFIVIKHAIDLPTATEVMAQAYDDHAALLPDFVAPRQKFIDGAPLFLQGGSVGLLVMLYGRPFMGHVVPLLKARGLHEAADALAFALEHGRSFFDELGDLDALDERLSFISEAHRHQPKPSRWKRLMAAVGLN